MPQMRLKHEISDNLASNKRRIPTDGDGCQVSCKCTGNLEHIYTKDLSRIQQPQGKWVTSHAPITSKHIVRTFLRPKSYDEMRNDVCMTSGNVTYLG